MPLNFVLRIKRAESPFFATLRRIALAVRDFDVPVPRLILPLARALYKLHWGIWFVARKLLAIFYVAPVFRGRCESSGRGLSVWMMPHILGHARIMVGSHVTFHGKFGVTSGRMIDRPLLRIGNNVVIGHFVQFYVNREVVVEDDVLIAGNCIIADSDGHPIDPEKRLRNLPPAPEDIKPVRICKNAWLAGGCQIRKGVTIGEGSIVGANSVVLSNVPPDCIVMGNPARVVGFTTANTGEARPGPKPMQPR